ncbi:sensor histidine kinase [Pedobacter terrae]|uniref:sensor histidine kinase n=1 Tax=Pedobacter terrae TaxID=405671 RepID=UPI002FFABAEE
MLKKINFRIIIQIVAAVFLLSLPLFIIADHDIKYIVTGPGLVQYILFCLIFISIYFLHSLYLFPKLYGKSRHILYVLGLLIILAGIIWLRPFDKFIFQNRNFTEHTTGFDRPPSPPDHKQVPPFEGQRFPPGHERGTNTGPSVDVASVFLFFLTIIISFTKETNKQLSLTTQRALIAEAEKAQAELSFLKAQVNPHFLFNTLNNIYTLAIIKDENTAPSIMKLSSIMRYITDETGNDFVRLQQELDCITNFIDLQKLRLTKKTTLLFELEGDFENKKIAPLILMAFTENVFKYGISNHHSNKLIIKIFSRQNSLILFCQNNLYPEKINTERSGIGLENTRRRLNHIYKNMHILTIDTSQNLFTVNLTIQL